LGEIGFVGQEGLPTGQRQRRWNQISWWYSLVLPVAVIFLIMSIVVDRLGSDPAVTGVVTDAYTGEPVEGARVAVGATAVETNGSGKFSFEAPVDGSLSISREDYESTQVAVDAADSEVVVTIRPTTLSGVVTNIRTDEPVVGATVSVSSPGEASVKTVTDEDGRYLLFDVPPDAVVTVSHAGMTDVSQLVGQNVVLDFDIRPDVVTGRIVDEGGNPVAQATIQIGGIVATSGPDGTYRLEGVPDTGRIVVKKAGYREVDADYPEDMTFDATLERFVVNALYVSASTAADEQLWGNVLELIDDTELNAVVLEVKSPDGYLRYDSDVPLAGEIGGVDAAFDLDERLEDLRDRSVYAIARISVFEDPLLAGARPELAIKDSTTGEAWTTWDGRAWVNPMNAAVWQYNVDVATELAAAGFDEIQLDFVRFPTYGPLEIADYGAPFSPESRTTAVTEFLNQMRAALASSGAFLAIDVVGVVLWDEGDNGIGQDLDLIVGLVDVVSPELFPSHFSPGTFGYDFPNDHPYSVIQINMERIGQRFGAAAYKFRPWLQDFSSGLGIDYGDVEVRAQIDASNEFGVSGWMLWSDDGSYSSGALALE
jgi:hypothetical protein